MKKLVSILAVSMVLFSCSKNDDSKTQPLIKVIENVSVQFTNENTSPENYMSQFEYNTKKEISKITLFRNGELQASFAYSYQNNIPVSAQYVNPQDEDNYLINYIYTNGLFSSVEYPSFNTSDAFEYNQSVSEFSRINGNLKFRLNTENDIFQKNINGTILNYAFDTTKKGPLYNVVNKKWIPTLWFITRLDADFNNITTSFPITSIEDETSAISYDYNNTYDADGFVIKSIYSNTAGSSTIEINFIYKSI